MSDTANAQANAGAGGTPPAPVARESIKRATKPVDVFLIETIDYSTVHGERAPGDPDHKLCFVQNGLPFDAEKKLIRDHRMVTDNPKAAAAITRMEARARKLADRAAAKAAEEEPEEDSELDSADDGDEPINLKAWAMGTKKYLWQLVSDTIVLKYSKRPMNKRDALETLISEGQVQPGQLSGEHKRALNSL
jgi:hypothetical protein